MAREFASLINRHNMALHQFFDNLLGLAISREQCAKQRDLVLSLCKELGWIVNQEKSELPQQVFSFVGIHYDLISLAAYPNLKN